MAIFDFFKNLGPGRTDSAKDGFDITPNDSADLPQRIRAIYIGTTGNIELITPKGTTLTYKNLPAGYVLVVEADRVKAGATTATDLIGMV